MPLLVYLTICNKFYLVWARANLAYFLEPSNLVCLTTPTNQNVCHMRIMHFWTVIMKSTPFSGQIKKLAIQLKNFVLQIKKDDPYLK